MVPKLYENIFHFLRVEEQKKNTNEQEKKKQCPISSYNSLI